MAAWHHLRPAYGGSATRRGPTAARRGAWGIARIVTAVARLVAAAIVLGILLIVFEANRGNELVNAALDVARFLAGPFRDIFDIADRKVEVAVNWGLAAVVYLAAARVIARLLVLRS